MFQAKDFYQLTGLKRSTVRYYQRQGLLLPARVEENGYSYYDDRALVDAMMIRNYRCVDFSIQDILDGSKFPLEAQIGHVAERKAAYQALIGELERKLKILDAYDQALKQYQTQALVVPANPSVELRAFSIPTALAASPAAAREEIAHCVNSFPFVHCIGWGELEELADHGEVHFEPGYEYRHDRDLFSPLHPELYRVNSVMPGLVLRLQAKEPLALSARELSPMTAELERQGRPLKGRLFTIVSGLVPGGEGLEYLVSVRLQFPE